jgi:hypothetical protein
MGLLVLLGSTNAAGFTDMRRHKGEQSYVSRPFNRYREFSLMARASTGAPPGLNLASIRDKTA